MCEIAVGAHSLVASRVLANSQSKQAGEQPIRCGDASRTSALGSIISSVPIIDDDVDRRLPGSPAYAPEMFQGLRAAAPSGRCENGSLLAVVGTLGRPLWATASGRPSVLQGR